MIVTVEQAKMWAEEEMQYYDSLPREIRDVIKEYGMDPYYNETPEKFLARCKHWCQLEQEDLLLQAA